MTSSPAAPKGVEGRFGRTAMEARDIGVSHWRYAPDFQSPSGTSTASRRRPTS